MGAIFNVITFSKGKGSFQIVTEYAFMMRVIFSQSNMGILS
ncbi:hypothetical protein APHCRT_0593 [Anaplasma phagocytophilum str. CRT53-1]|uniref:Uncharacterized protein n=2 Tax=Anaplasma phagocytophilum TaxID=948 RepID=A0A0F3NGY0_ANAPH|nr:hypothetical protein EPHNCH_0766 [Anaplasma phagocytophilum str. NCH-1]KJV86078.1 hypothetical protein APHCRT_0593 [Anaplasma phagocytophilum str. CRT53-1]KKA00892.1 hypothetical protein APHCR_1512 [Anaplasma phagocytophilum str. CR1007]